jgi:hypothetical protein
VREEARDDGFVRTVDVREFVDEPQCGLSCLRTEGRRRRTYSQEVSVSPAEAASAMITRLFTSILPEVVSGAPITHDLVLLLMEGFLLFRFSWTSDPGLYE